MLSDFEISRNCNLRDITAIADKLRIAADNIENYGKYKAKIPSVDAAKGKLILVTAINPTAAGEGKTTVSIGLADAISRAGKKVCLALREPSLGPVFGIKGGAAGGGYAQVVPMEDINLHFTGDLHAITACNNLLCALIDNHIFQGNPLELDSENIYFHRCMDMNDRALRNISVGLQLKTQPRDESFTITAASEIMAILCLSSDNVDLKRRLGNIVVGKNKIGEYIYAKQLKAEGAMALLLKDAIKPNLVQTLEGTPAIVHGGPFANIAHGCNSVIATKTAMSLAEYTVTEAGFGADLGAEKFFEIKCRVSGIEPSAVVVVATVKALKLHGGAAIDMLGKEDIEALKKGLPNLLKHISNISSVFNKPVTVALNRFASDTENELNCVKTEIEKIGFKVCFTEVFAKGGEGGKELAEEVLRLCDTSSKLNFAYELFSGIKDKINSLVTKIYGGNGAEYSEAAEKKIIEIEKNGYGNLPVVIAKTQFSLSDNANLLAAPKDFVIHVNDVELKAGAEFIVAKCGNVMLMPGLSKNPAACNMDIDESGDIKGLF